MWLRYKAEATELGQFLALKFHPERLARPGSRSKTLVVCIFD
jgi:hypothetical protein